MFCVQCGNELLAQALICPKCGCGTENYKISEQIKSAQASQTATKNEERGGKNLIVFGYVCSLGAWLIFGIALGIVGVVIGIINIVRNRIGHGITQIVISATAMVVVLFGILK